MWTPAEWIARLRTAIWRRSDADLEEEVRSHLTMAADDAARSGLDPSAATRRPVLRAGRADTALEALRDRRGFRWVGEVAADARYGLRRLMASPAFATAAIASVALGVGLNTAVFSVVDAALLRPLPYRDADQLVTFGVAVPTRDGPFAELEATPNWHLAGLRRMSSVFEQVEVHGRPASRPLATPTQEPLDIGALTPAFTDFLGVPPQLGRALSEDDVRSDDVMLISDGYWQRAFGRSPHAIGATIPFADRSRTVVGVMPSTFRYMVGHGTDGWRAIAAPGGDVIVGRLRAGLTLPDAQQRVTQAIQAPGAQWRPAAVTLYPATWERGRHYFGGQSESSTPVLYSLLAASGLLLAIGCVNLISLLALRIVGRQREVAMRLALGATRGRVARQLAVEAVIIGALGVAAAVCVAWGAIAVVPAIVPPALESQLFLVSVPVLDSRVFGFGAVVCLVVLGASASGCALVAGRVGASGQAARSGGRTIGLARWHRRMQGGLQATQVAIAALLLAGSGVLLLSMFRLATIPPGFNAEGLMYASFDDRALQFQERPAMTDALLERLRTHPAFTEVTMAEIPVSGNFDGHVLVEAGLSGMSPATPVMGFRVRPDYFAMTGILLREGRLFGDADRAGAPAAIVSERLARLHWPGLSGIGQRFRLYPTSDWLTIVGVVNDVRTLAIQEGRVEVYRPASQAGEGRALLFRTRGSLDAAAAVIRTTLRDVDPRVVVMRVGPVELADSWGAGSATRFYGVLFGLFAIVAVVTAALGLHALSAHALTRRTGEIGVRMALGASPRRVARLMLAETVMPVVAGLGAGLAAAWWLLPLLEQRLFRVAPRDPVILSTIAVVFLVVAVSAVWIPVRRATRIDPAITLKAE